MPWFGCLCSFPLIGGVGGCFSLRASSVCHVLRSYCPVLSCRCFSCSVEPSSPPEGLVAIDVQWAGCEQGTVLETEFETWPFLKHWSYLWFLPFNLKSLFQYLRFYFLRFKSVFLSLVVLWKDLCSEMKRRQTGYIKATKLFIWQNFDRSRKQKTWGKNKIILPFLVECTSVLAILDGICNKWESGELCIEFRNTFFKKRSIDPLEKRSFSSKRSP